MSGLLDAINALPNKRTNAWTKEEDEALLVGWETKMQTDVAKILGKRVATCRERYRELKRV